MSYFPEKTVSLGIKYMTLSLKKRLLSKPKKGEKIDLFDIAFVRARNRNKAHSALLEEFVSSEITKAELAVMLDKRPEQITRWLAGPSNLTLDTLSDLIFALRGNFIELQSKDELSRGKSNARSPEWLRYTDVKELKVSLVHKSLPDLATVVINSHEIQHHSSEGTGNVNDKWYISRGGATEFRSKQ
ncbi:MAG: hypothetical protein ACEQSU_16835 [Microgenomates group bacterium]